MEELKMKKLTNEQIEWIKNNPNSIDWNDIATNFSLSEKNIQELSESFEISDVGKLFLKEEKDRVKALFKQ